MVVPVGGRKAAAPCLVGGNLPNGLDLVADEALGGLAWAIANALKDRLQAPSGDSFGRLAPLLAGLTHPPIEVAEVTVCSAPVKTLPVQTGYWLK